MFSRLLFTLFSQQGYCLSYEPGTEQEIECDVPKSPVSTSSTDYSYEQALDRSDSVNGGIDETEFVSSRHNNQHQATGSSSRGGSWPVLTLLASVFFLHYI